MALNQKKGLTNLKEKHSRHKRNLIEKEVSGKNKVWKTNPTCTGRPGDVLWRSPKSSDVQDLQGTFRGFLGNQHKNWWFNEKKCLLDAIVLVLRIYYCFPLKKQKLKSSKWGRPWDVCRTQLRNAPGTKWWDVLRTYPGRRSYVFFKLSSETY